MLKWLSLVAIVTLPACSTLLEGTTQSLSFASEPTGAECTLTRADQVIGIITTPGSVLVRKTKDDITATCRKAGYDDASARLRSGAAAATFGNVVAGLLGGPIAWGIDSATGADNKYDHKTTVTLVPTAAAAPAPASNTTPVPTVAN